MARTNNLSNYLTDVATAIKTKKGDSTPILASNFDTEIVNLPSSSDPYEYFLDELADRTSPLVSLFVKKIPKIISGGYTTVNNMFNGYSNLEEIDVSGFDTSNATNFTYMFANCYKLTTVNTEELDMSSATTVSNMFNNCESLREVDLSNLRQVAITDIGRMFYGCRRLKKVDLSNFNTTSTIVTAINAFNNCTQMEELDVRSLDFANFDTSSIIRGFFGSSTSNGIPNGCKVIVADSTQKEIVEGAVPRLTNVVTVAELGE